MMHDAKTTSTAMAYDAMTTTSSAMMYEPTSTAEAAATTAVMYGSGSSNWGTDLNSCVQSELLVNWASEIGLLTCMCFLSVPG